MRTTTSDAKLYFLLAMVLLLAGCAGSPAAPVASVASQNAPEPLASADSCIVAERTRLNEAKPQPVLETLDGQVVPLRGFFDICEKFPHLCELDPKFSLWKQETRQVVYRTERGPSLQIVRFYLNSDSACAQEPRDPGKPFGDVVEFYDAKGEFLGLGVYRGNGQYFPIPYRGYFEQNGV